VRAATPVNDEAPAPVVQDFGNAESAEAPPRRRRRTRREMIEAAGEEAGFTPDVETPAAE
jgi:hypothetical protein